MGKKVIYATIEVKIDVMRFINYKDATRFVMKSYDMLKVA